MSEKKKAKIPYLTLNSGLHCLAIKTAGTTAKTTARIKNIILIAFTSKLGDAFLSSPDLKFSLSFSKYFLAGSVPILISCGLQLWFGFDRGPYEILNGLIIWFQYPIEGVRGLTGLFSNQNITGIWLTITLAFSLGLLKHERNFFISFILIIINFLIVYFVF